MMKSLMLTMFMAVIGFAIQASAQVFGGPVGGAPVDPGMSAWGSGQYMMASPCAYAGGWSDPLDVEDDVMVSAAKDGWDAAKEAKAAAAKGLEEARNKLRDARADLMKYMKGNKYLTEKSFEVTLVACESAFSSWSPSSDSKMGSRSHQWLAAIRGNSGLPDNDSKGACANATQGARNSGAQAFDPGSVCKVASNPNICESRADGEDCSSSPDKELASAGINTTDFGHCHAAANKLLAAVHDYSNAEAAVKQTNDDEKKAYAALKAARKDAQKEKKEELKNQDPADAEYAGCPTCASMKRQKMDKNQMILGLAIGGGEILAQSLVQNAANNRNARLGYPSGPNPFVSSLSYGMPYIYGGLYGGMYGGMSQGSFGCSPGMYGGGMYGGGPWAGGSYGGMGYPYGGGMYMPGYGPWGYAGPWGANGMGMGMPGMYPGMGGGLYGGMGTGMPGMGGMYPGMGGMMGGPFGPFGPFGSGMGGGLYGGLGMGMPGMYGMGGPFGMGGMGMPGMGGMYPGMGGMMGSPFGMGGMGGMGMGMPGMGGMGADYQIAMLQQQLQSFSDYERRLQVYTGYMTQVYQLQQQAYSVMMGSGAGGMGYGMGGMGGYGGLGGFGGTGYGVGVSLGGSFGLGGSAVPTYLGQPGAATSGPNGPVVPR